MSKGDTLREKKPDVPVVSGRITFIYFLEQKPGLATVLSSKQIRAHHSIEWEREPLFCLETWIILSKCPWWMDSFPAGSNAPRWEEPESLPESTAHLIEVQLSAGRSPVRAPPYIAGRVF